MAIKSQRCYVLVKASFNSSFNSHGCGRYLDLIRFSTERSEFEYLMRTDIRQPELIVSVNRQPVGQVEPAQQSTLLPE